MCEKCDNEDKFSILITAKEENEIENQIEEVMSND